MAAVWLLARREVRRRARSLLGLGLVVALVTAVVLTASAGVRRTATSFERFRDESRATDAWVQIDDPDLAPRLVEAIDDLPMVADSAGWVVTPTLPLDAPTDAADFALMGDPGGRFGTEVDRPRVIEGRLPSLEASDEVMLTQTTSELFDIGVGEALRLRSFSPTDLEALVTSDGFPGFNGPELELSVVGVGLWPEEMGGRLQSAVLAGLVSPAFERTHGDTVGSWPISSRVRLADPADLPALEAAVDDLAGPDTEVIIETAQANHVGAIQAAIDAIASATFLATVIAALAGLVAVGQAISRQTGMLTDTSGVLGALGQSRHDRALALSVPTILAGTLGVAVGAGVSYLASPLLPFGLARRAEPAPGVWLDPIVLLVGSLLLVVYVAGWAYAAARRAMRLARSGERARSHVSRLATLLAGTGVRPARVIGVRFAFDPGAGRTAVPVRTAIVGGAMGVAGVVAVSVVAVSLAALVAHPDRWGWTWSSRPDIYGEVEPTLDALVSDDRIDHVAGLSYASIDLGGEQSTGYAVESLKGSIALTIVSGRAPVGAAEVALGRRTLHDLDRTIGDRVSLAAADGSGNIEAEIVGVVATPLVESTDPGRGAVLTIEGLDAVRQSDGSRQLLLGYHAGVDAAALEEDLAETAGLGFPVYSRPGPPGEVGNLQSVQGTAVALVAFFALLGTIGVAHALAVSVRRRRPDLQVLQVLGFVRGQVRAAVRWQAVTTAGTSALVGTPVGLIVGRAAWLALVGDMGVIADPSQPWLVLALVVPTAILIGLAVAWLPAHAAVRVRPSTSSRTD